jgi:hypothetical protein
MFFNSDDDEIKDEQASAPKIGLSPPRLQIKRKGEFSAKRSPQQALRSSNSPRSPTASLRSPKASFSPSAAKAAKSKEARAV